MVDECTVLYMCIYIDIEENSLSVYSILAVDEKSGTNLRCSQSKLDIYLDLKGLNLNITELPRSRMYVL